MVLTCLAQVLQDLNPMFSPFFRPVGPHNQAFTADYLAAPITSDRIIPKAQVAPDRFGVACSRRNVLTKRAVATGDIDKMHLNDLFGRPFSY